MIRPFEASVDGFRRAAFGAIYRAAVRVRSENTVFARMEFLKTLENESVDVVMLLQRRLLSDLLRESVPRVPRLRPYAAIAEGLTPANVRERLRELPILEKETLQISPESCVTNDESIRYVTKTTGGSTGRPVTVRKNPDAIAQEMAATWVSYGWFGVNIGDPCVRFWGQPVRNLRRRLRYLAADTAMHRLTLSAFGYSRSDLLRYVKTIKRYRPSYIYGYVSAIEDLARFLLDRGETVRLEGLKSVITTSEVLSPPQRAAIQNAFQVAVQNEYGCGEVGPMAYECPSGSLHLIPTNQFIEIVRPDGSPAQPGEPGSVIVTDLTNLAMPLIRYRVGDTAAFDAACPCGRPSQTLSTVFGREYDFVEGPDGRRFHGEYFMYLFEDLRRVHPEVGQFQVIQMSMNSLIVKLQVMANASDAPATVLEQMRQRLPEFKVAVECVNRLERRPSGKMLVVENRCTK